MPCRYLKQIYSRTHVPFLLILGKSTLWGLRVVKNFILSYRAYRSAHAPWFSVHFSFPLLSILILSINPSTILCSINKCRPVKEEKKARIKEKKKRRGKRVDSEMKTLYQIGSRNLEVNQPNGDQHFLGGFLLKEGVTVNWSWCGFTSDH